MTATIKTRPHDLVPKAKWVTLRLTGLTPLLLHNGEGADQLNPFQREIKSLTDRMKAKTISTEDAEEQKSWLQFQAALYWDKDGIGLYMPGLNVFRSVMEGGSALGRLGTKVDAAVVDMDDQCPIDPYTSRYDDPRAMFDAGLLHRVPVKVGQSKVVSTRPRFSPWTIDMNFAVQTDVMPVEQFVECAETAGRVKGIGDGRLKGYRHGRFSVDVV